MKPLALFRLQRRYRSGDDAFSQSFADAMKAWFSPVSLSEVAPQWHDDLLESLPLSLVPFRHGIYNRTVRPALIRDAVRRLPSGGVVCVRDELWRGDATAAFEREIASRSTYVFNYFDNWFAVPHLAPRAMARCKLATLIVVPTERLREICDDLFPTTSVACIEEPVDCSRFDAMVGRKAPHPTVIWAGNPLNHSELIRMRDLLAAVHAVRPFDLVVLSGDRKPTLPLSIPWTWVPFSAANEQDWIPRAWAGVSRLVADAYDAAKGCYKTKTYMAAGTVPVVTDIGHARKVLQAAKAGCLVPADDEQAWIDAIVHVLSSREEAIREGARAREFARTRFAYESIAAEWAAAIREVV